MNLKNEKFTAGLFVIFFLTMLGAFSLDIYRWWKPASEWLTVDRVYVKDAYYLRVPVMEVDRTIHNTFKGEWLVEVHKKTSQGFALVVGCSGNGENIYRPTDKLPVGDKLNLEWWMWPKKCRLDPGEYRLDTVWTISPEGYPSKEVHNLSNVFKIK